MAILTLTKVWVNRLDTGESVSAQSGDRKREHKIDGEVRTYSGGRRRSVSYEGLHGTFGFTLANVHVEDVAVLQSWLGIAVQIRDHRGQLFVGVIYKIDVLEWKSDFDRYDVSMALDMVTE